MPAPDLIIPAPLSTATEAILAGADLHTTAAGAGVDPERLAEAVDVYRAAGVAALCRRSEDAWVQVYVTPADFHTVEQTVATQLGPLLDQTGAGWWFLRKYPDWRIRTRARAGVVIPILDRLTETGTITGWRRSVYEPEEAAFGGPAAMAAVHDLFCADTAGLLGHLRQSPGGPLRREVSLVLLRALQHAAGLDAFESGAVYDAVAQLRPEPADQAKVTALAAGLAPMLHAPVGTFPDGHALAHTRLWVQAFGLAGSALRALADTGQLGRGLRNIIAHIVIFHWNRIGLPADVQGVLAHAARAATLPKD
ncbi:hypothetical protein DMB66_40305 [Actinoplanes sp. ATCC 53533]|uniref:thiopeptide-type bacteriocin biosynthesis protein n=1 Tax=Actinoplanes sp. ATCC 53533 TaxID=1288362 RepID=UPI000F7AE546|nr:thiopeptide-type bacteriocin biosynthesis protein [Actinoplanes sp. ATCC 53533]RSM52345.1 hypothetical protein DMB66_40305 [Actinoplanes sp. ATCC 53533]